MPHFKAKSLKCTKFVYRWSSLQTSPGSLFAPQTPNYTWGLLLSGGEGREGERRRGKGGEREEKGRRGRVVCPRKKILVTALCTPNFIFLPAPLRIDAPLNGLLYAQAV